MDTAKILIVDDQIDALRGVSRIMRGAGYETFEASNGTDCLKLAAEHKPDLILLDVVLPDIDGMEVCKRIKSDPETADIYVILLSSIHTESDSQAKGLEYGADGYIARPIPNRELVARVKSILRLKITENRLRASEEKYRNIFNIAGVGMYRSRLDGSEILDVNDKFLQILIQTREDVIGKPSAIVWADPHERKKLVRSINTDGKVDDVEIKLLTSQGQERTCLNSVRLYPDEGIIEGYIVDITDRKRMEENILASEQRLRAVTESAFDAIILIDDRGEISFWNKASERIFGYTASEAIGRNLHDILAPPEFQAAHRSAFKDFIVSGRGSALGKITPLVARRKNGEDFPIELSLSGFQTGGRWQAAGIVRDIADRKRAEKELDYKQALLQGLLESIPDMVFFKDMNGVYLGGNPEFASFVGSKSQDIIGHTDYDLFSKDVAGFHRENDRIMMEQGVPRHNEEWIDYPDGRRCLLDTYKALLRLPNGELIGLLGVSRDITESKNAEMALAESEQRYRSLFEGSRDGIVFTDMDGLIK